MMFFFNKSEKFIIYTKSIWIDYRLIDYIASVVRHVHKCNFISKSMLSSSRLYIHSIHTDRRD